MKITAENQIHGPSARATRAQLERTDNTEPSSLERMRAFWWIVTNRRGPRADTYLLTMNTTAELEGVDPVDTDDPDTTHVLQLAAFDPRLKPRMQSPHSWQTLPPLFVCHLPNLEDDDARAVAGVLARAVVDGNLPPDPMLTPMASNLWITAAFNARDQLTITTTESDTT